MELGTEEKLKSIHSFQKSFGGKAVTRTDVGRFGKYHSLFSYGTFIIEIKEFEDGTKIINAMTEIEEHLTNTTIKHLNEFVMQHGMSKKTKRQWLKQQLNQVNYDY